MKKLRRIIIASICVFCLTFTAACSNRLEMPSKFRFNADTLELSWNKIDGAVNYALDFNGDGLADATTSKNSYSLTKLDPGVYDVAVQAVGIEGQSKNSGWAVYENYERAEESGLSYKLINANTEYELVGPGTAKGDVVMESMFRGKPVTSIKKKALNKAGGITSIRLGDHVKTIGEQAFMSSGLTTITNLDGVESIGINAFTSCKKLQSVELPDSLTVLPNNLFNYCSVLETVTVGNAVTEVGEFAFANCAALTKISLPDTVTTIGKNAFYNCGLLEEANLGDNIETIAENVFQQCASLTKVSFGDKVKTIGDYSFSGTSLTSIELPESVEAIGNYAFQNSDKLASVTIGSNVKSIGSDAFDGTALWANNAENLVYVGDWLVGAKADDIGTSLVPKANTVGVADFAFYNNANIVDMNLNSVKYVGYAAFAGCVKLHAVELNNAVELGDYAFYGCELLKIVTLTETLKEIGSYAFSGCKRLAETVKDDPNTSDNELVRGIDIPDSIVHIGTYAFENTALFKSQSGVVYAGKWIVGATDTFLSLDGVKLREGTVGIADYSFFGCAFIGNVRLPNSIRFIGEGAFIACTYLLSINLPESLEEIGAYAFYECGYMVLVYPEGDKLVDGVMMYTIPQAYRFPSNLKSIGLGAFYHCMCLGGIEGTGDYEGYILPGNQFTIPGNVKEIGDYAFYGCPSLGNVVLENGVEKLGSWVFFECKGMYSVTLADTLTEIGYRNFYKCEGLKTANIGNGLKRIDDYTFYGCISLENVNIGTGLEEIGKYAFRNCTSLKTISLPANVKTIEEFAFYSSGLEFISLNTGVTNIGNYAFRNCKQLKSVILGDQIEVIGKHVFNGDVLLTIYSETAEAGAEWDKYWNSAYRPVIWSATASEDGSYVESFTKGEITNASSLNPDTAPARKGYTFVGWATSPDGEAVYGAGEVINVADGTKLYSVWVEGVEEPELPEEGTEGGTEDSNTNA